MSHQPQPAHTWTAGGTQLGLQVHQAHVLINRWRRQVSNGRVAALPCACVQQKRLLGGGGDLQAAAD